MKSTHFITIDLELKSNDDITLLVEELSLNGILMRHQVDENISYASFEVEGFTVEEIMKNFIVLINNLTPAAKELWNNCTKRDFDFGFNSGTHPHSFNMQISNSILQNIVEIGGSISVTIYKASQENV